MCYIQTIKYTQWNITQQQKEQTTDTFNDKNDSHRYYADSKENRYKALKTV